MAALTSGSWTVTYKNGDQRRDTLLTDMLRQVNLKIAIASGTWPATGITLPAFAKAGMRTRLDMYDFGQSLYTVSGSAGAGVSGALQWTYLATTNKLRPFRVIKATGTGGVITPLVTTANVAAQNFYVSALGW